MARKKQFYSADEAIALLKVTKGTLYSYVSRGLLRSEEVGGKTRARRYLAADVDALVEKKQQRKNPERVAKTALHWGAPVLESALTAIEGGSFYYRGYDATMLALERTFEEVANLLWSGELGADLSANLETAWGTMPGHQDEAEALWKQATALIQVDELEASAIKPLEAFQILLPAIGAADLAAYTLEKDAIIRTAHQILQVMTSLAAGSYKMTYEMENSQKISIARALQKAWVPDDQASPQSTDAPTAERLFNAALILCADHELNVSSFTVRCVASAGSSPYAAVVAGLSALQGHKHGGQSELVELLFKEAESNVQSVIANRLKRGEAIPGFGQPLYPDGDPRCRVLLALVDAYSQGANDQNAALLETAHTIIEAVAHHVGKAPTLDFGLTVLSKALGLPDGAPLTLFAIGRTAGWIGHYIEQIGTDQLIRPRATYVGPRILEDEEA